MFFDGKDLATGLAQEFGAGTWGDIDPDWFALASLSDDELNARNLDPEQVDNVVLLRQLLDRVAMRFSAAPPVQDKTDGLPPPPEGYTRVLVDRRMVTVPRVTTGRAILLACGIARPDHFILVSKTLDGKTTTRVDVGDEVVCEGVRFTTIPRSQTGG